MTVTIESESEGESNDCYEYDDRIDTYYMMCWPTCASKIRVSIKEKRDGKNVILVTMCLHQHNVLNLGRIELNQNQLQNRSLGSLNNALVKKCRLMKL